MDAFKKKLAARQWWLAVGVLGLIAAFVLTFNLEAASVCGLQSFIAGFQTGFTIVIGILLLVILAKTRIAIRNPEQLKKAYIAETDERSLMIRQKAGSAVMNIIMYGLSVGALVAGNFNETVFVTLLAACLFVGLVGVSFKLYYRVKL